jgi:hypothetical protein
MKGAKVVIIQFLRCLLTHHEKEINKVAGAKGIITHILVPFMYSQEL